MSPGRPALLYYMLRVHGWPGTSLYASAGLTIFSLLIRLSDYPDLGDTFMAIPSTIPPMAKG